MTWNLASGLEGKRVVVTGGAGGIGREVALAFGAAGSRVAVIDVVPTILGARVVIQALDEIDPLRDCDHTDDRGTVGA